MLSVFYLLLKKKMLYPFFFLHIIGIDDFHFFFFSSEFLFGIVGCDGVQQTFKDYLNLK